MTISSCCYHNLFAFCFLLDFSRYWRLDKVIRLDHQITFRKQATGQGKASGCLLFTHMAAAHALGLVAAGQHPDLAHSTAAATTADINGVAAGALQPSQQGLASPDLELFVTVDHGNVVGCCGHTDVLLSLLCYRRLNRAERRCSVVPSRAVRNFSIWMSFSNRRPCIRVLMAASIIGGGPHI